jgi:hypothetical protein
MASRCGPADITPQHMYTDLMMESTDIYTKVGSCTEAPTLEHTQNLVVEAVHVDEGA